MRALFILGRTIFGGFFVWNGVNQLMHRKQMSQYAASKGVPSAELAIPATGGMLLAGGMSVLTGVKPREGLATLIGFLVPVTLQMHKFWEVDDPQQRQNELIHFSKNVALIGASLMMMQIQEPWPASLTPESEEMFVRLGGRELRGLPA